MVKLVITENQAGQRLDRFLKKYMKKAPLSAIYKFIRKDIKLNGRRAKEDTMLCEGDELTLYIPDDKFKELSEPVKKKPVKKQFKIVYEDDNLLIVDKPWGLLTHGDAHEKKNTLANQVCGYLKEKGEYDPALEKTFVPSPVNRLDRNTTGLVIFGKNSKTLRVFAKYISEKSHINKYYMTIVAGCFKESMMLEGRLERDYDRNVSEVTLSDEAGKKAETYVMPFAWGTAYSIVEVELITGRTHQIRAHLSHEGYPLIGDVKYGSKRINDEIKKKLGITTQLLHAYRLEFKDMEDGFEYLNGKTVKAQIPQDFRKAAEKLGFAIRNSEVLGK